VGCGLPGSQCADPLAGWRPIIVDGYPSRRLRVHLRGYGRAVRRELSVDMFGLKLSIPLFVAPIGVLGLCAQDGHGDLAAARAAAHTGIPMVASTLSVDPLEEVAAEFR
jgi:isopentenyl diphosphate isomerase/L-lactate dehydrogenase-like FMN-dependent dehydrogenase